MKIDEFIELFAEQCDETDRGEFIATTQFKNIEEWSSLTALSVIAMVDEEYDVTLKGNDLESSTTIEDLFKLVNSKL